jgi:hypothetical protein
MRRLCAIALLLAITGCGGSAPQTVRSVSADAAQRQATTQELRNTRYCEVLASVQTGATITTYVYSTLGFNECPAEQWNALTVDEVNAEFGSQSADLNGPRYWVLDSLSASGGSTTGQTFTFGGIKMGLRATILGTAAGQVGQSFYVPAEVHRTTVWTYDAGKPIFELTAPDGGVYVMQSYAQIVDKTLTYEQLASLGSKLSLPPGWTYSVQTPSTTLQLVASGIAYVVMDKLQNSYQRR